MSKRDDDALERRMLRLNGEKPTARDRWTAFYRLWRLAHGHGPYHDMDANMCFRVLFSDWEPIHLLDALETDGYVDRAHVPTFIRKDSLRIRRKQRLYAGHYEWIERDKVVANRLRAEHGMEVTPLEVAETRRKVINEARRIAAEQDFAVPADDEELLRLLKPKD